MVDFGHDYWHAMDNKPLETVDLSTKDVGISMGIGDPWQSIKTAVTAGATTVELGFMGAHKGSISSPTSITPGTIGKTKREDIRTFAKLNNVKLTTHASPNINPVSGFSRDARGFSDMVAQNSIMEIKRAIDFAADTAEGGAVVFHTAEFPRDITSFNEFQPKYGEWQKEEVASLVNKETGQVIQFQKGQVLLEPKWKTNEMGQYVDSEDNVIKPEERFVKGVPVYDENGRVKFNEKRWNDFEKEAQEWNKQHPDQKTSAAKLFYIASQRSQVERAAPFAYNYMRAYEQGVKDLELLKKALNDTIELENATPKKNWFMIKNNIKNNEELRKRGIDIPDDVEKPSEFLKEQLKQRSLHLEREKQGFMGYSQELEQMEKMQKEIVPIEEYGVKRSAQKMAEVAMYAYEVTKKKKLKKPLFIAPENVFPENGYGAHPQELKKLIMGGREEMVKILKQKGVSEDKAKKLAETHIKATFDIAHANTWRKFFNKSDEEFDKWLEKQVDDLMKNKVIGHAHVSDNFGYYDEHVSPGEGNTPIEMFMEKLNKNKDFKGHIVTEPGAQGEGESIFGGMFGAWAKLASSPMYRVGAVSKTWSDIQGSYFGRTYSPSVISGQYHINPKGDENWWSGTPIE
ncbi:sugar phosphate isomerase/epimerase [Candidatus Woesearchaeota archaeon]|nr:MAG: sugar phosphate isomerase/epimerase [Candidatus Woesearchaeota archaeon]